MSEMPPGPLPAGATEESRARHTIACHLIDRCPPQFAEEVAITGSVARGLADRFSDIEIICWNEQMPGSQDRNRWLDDVGVDETRAYPAEDIDGTEWVTCRYQGVWIEIGWARYGAIEEILDGLLSGERGGHALLQIAALICHAVPLRSGGRLAAWKERLRHYPDDLQARVIRDNTAVWADPHVPPVRWALAARDSLMPLAMRLTWDIQNLWAVVHAINRRWEPDYKWVIDEAIDLPIKPDRLAERMNRVFALEDPERSVRDAYELILEVLALVPPEHDVSAARASIEAALRANRSR